MALKLAALVLIALAAACGRNSAPPAEPANAAAPKSDPTAGANVADTAAPAASCRVAPEAAVDAASFARDDLPAFLPERIETLRTAAGEAFRRVAAARCASGDVPAERLAGIRRLLVQSASGADNVAFYEDAESQPPGTLVFQWVFAEADLALPDDSDIGEGLACWASPEREECAGREP